MKGNVFQLILGVTAIALAGCAAYFSVFGLSKLFAGAALSIIIMASILELAKLVSVSYLYTHWKDISSLLKTYLITGTFILMLITSLGIYGYLSNAFQITASGLDRTNKQISLIENKKSLFQTELENYNKQLDLKNKRINSLTDLRNNQESRIDTLYKWGKSTSAKRTEDLIKDADLNIKSISTEMFTDNKKISLLNDSISKYELQIIELSSNSFSADLGPLKYLSDLLHKPMNIVVNWFMLLLIFVFDPLAVSLVIAYNQLSAKNSKKEKSIPFINNTIEDAEKVINEKKPQVNKVDEPNNELFKSFEQWQNNKNKENTIEEPINVINTSGLMDSRTGGIRVS